MRLPLLVALLGLATLLAPLAASDHVFSHRLVVTGRVLGADGAPVAGAPINVTFDGVAVGGQCLQREDGVTSETGDFTLCRHAHDLPGRDVVAHVRVQGETFDAVVDPVTRRVAMHLVLDEPSTSRDIGGERLFNRTVRVEGRLMLLGDVNVEGVDVNASPIFGREIDARIVTANGIVVVRGNDTTNDQGDYAVVLETTQLPDDARVEVRYGDDLRNVTLDPRIRRADVDVLIDPRADAEPPIQPPGTGKVRVPGIELAFLVLGVLASSQLRSRMR